MLFAQLEVGLAEHLVAVLFLDDVVERRELEAADGRRARYQRNAADRAATRVAKDRSGCRKARTARREGARVTDERPAALRVLQEVPHSPVALCRCQFGTVLVSGGKQEAAEIGIPSAHGIDAVVAVRSIDMLVIAADLEAFVARAGDEVHNACYSIRAVRCGRAILQDLDAPDSRQRQDVRVDRAVTGESERVRCEALAIEQHQSARGTKAAQVDRARALGTLRASVKLVRIAQNTAGDRQRLDDV